MTFEEWFERYPWRDLCEACRGTRFRHDGCVPREPKETCLECLSDRLHVALRRPPPARGS